MFYFASFVFCAVFALGGAQLPTNQDNPCDHRHGVTGDVTYCDRYWECVNGEAHLYDCPNGLVFVGRNRGIAEGCDYPWRGAYCQSKIRGVSEEKTRANPPISTEHCNWLYGIFGHETSCTRYWTCWNGTSAEQFCIGGLLFNEETHSCDWPQNVPGCQKHPLCKDDPNANVPLGESCERYWSCQGGYPRLQRCPATLVFEKLSRRCVAPPTVDCDVPPPPLPEEIYQEPVGRPQNPGNRARGQNRQRFEEQPTQQFIEEQPIHPNQGVRSRPRPQLRRPQLSLPQGAIPIQFNQNRPPPIEDAIPLN